MQSHCWRALLIAVELALAWAVNVASPGMLRHLPPADCMQFSQPSMWLRQTKLFEPHKTDFKLKDRNAETIENRQFFTVACRPAHDVENVLGIPWHVVLAHTGHTEYPEIKSVLRRALTRLSFRHVSVDADAVPTRFEKQKGGLRAAFDDRLPDSYFIVLLPHPSEHCLGRLENHQSESNKHKVEALGLCHNPIHRSVRFTKGETPEQTIAQYDLPIPVERLDEALVVLRAKLQVEMPDILYVRRSIAGGFSPPLAPAEKVAIKSLTGVGMVMSEEQRTTFDSFRADGEDDEDELLDPDELKAKDQRISQHQSRQDNQDSENLHIAMQKFVLSNHIDFQLLSYAHAKLNQDILRYGPQFAGDMEKFRKLMAIADVKCGKVSEDEEDTCLRKLSDGVADSDL